MYTYKNLGFRPIEEGDLERLRQLRNDMSTLLQLGSVDMVSSEEQHEWWKGLAHRQPEKRYSILDLSKEEIVGVIRIQHIDPTNGHCEIGLDIIPARRGQGLGTTSYEMILEYLFLHYNMHMVYLRVGEFNEGALTLYRRLGFHETGRFKEYLYRHGRYWDYILMCMTKDQYLSRRP